MRVYLNTSVLNRPIDDLSSERVRAEAEDVVRLLSAAEAGAVAERARALERFGLRGLDALHVAAAEAGRAEMLVTTDDRMVRSAARAGGALRLRIVPPAAALATLAGVEKP